MMKIQCKTQLQYNNQVRVQDFLDRWLTSNTLTPYQTGLVPRALSLSYGKWVRAGFIQVLWFDASWFPNNLLKSAALQYWYILTWKMGFLLGHHTHLHISPGSGQSHLVPGPSLAEQFLGSCISLEGGERERETYEAWIFVWIFF